MHRMLNPQTIIHIVFILRVPARDVLCNIHYQHSDIKTDNRILDTLKAVLYTLNPCLDRN